MFVVAVAVLTFATPVLARGPAVAEVTPDDVHVGGEPGEDPHLRLIPRVECADDLNYLRSSRGSGAGVQTIKTTQTEGFGEGAERYLGSRMERAWLAMLETWFWMMHR